MSPRLLRAPGATATYHSGSAGSADLADHLRHEVLAMLGQGDMGAVYKARHTKMDQLVPLKVIIGLAEILAGLLTPAE